MGLAQIKHVMAVGSGKGGVGKSTLAVNLAFALALQGKRVGLLDADIYGPSAGTLLGLAGQKPMMDDKNHVIAMEAHGIKVMSMSQLTDAGKPVIMRGPMLSGILMQFAKQVSWGELDYLILDLPPGTGDVQLTLCQQIQIKGAILVSTPQEMASQTMLRGLRMFESLKVPILGIVENMSYFHAEDTGRDYDLFGRGKVKKLAESLGYPFLGEIPIHSDMVKCSDEGRNLLIEEPMHVLSQAFAALAGRLETEVEKIDQLKSNQNALFEYNLDWEKMK